jgi:hypothetical protein
MRTFRSVIGVIAAASLSAACAADSALEKQTPTGRSSATPQRTFDLPDATQMPEADAWRTVRSLVPPSQPVLMPTWLPDRYRGGIATIGYAHEGSPGLWRYQIGYRAIDGKLIVFSLGAVNSAPPTTSETATVRGVQARLVTTGSWPAIEMQWDEADDLYSIQSTGLSRDEILRIAAGLKAI